MTPQSIADPAEIGPLKVAPGRPKDAGVPRAAFLDDWLDVHLNALALVVLAAGFGMRVFTAAATYLNPDEALHYVLINQNSVWLAYKASLTNAHPPLIYLILYYWHFLGRSELMLRVPSVITGTAFCWVFYKWTRIVFGRTAGLVGLILAAFSPALITLSAEVREYALLLFCVSCALYFLARAFEDKSVRQMWCFSVFLYLAILSHYSAVFFTVAVGLYCLARIADSRPAWNFAAAWAAGQAGALAIYAFLYVTHVSKIKKNELALWASPFDTSFFHSGHQSLLTFTARQTSSVFLFLFEHEYISPIMLLFFIAGVALLFFRDLASRDRTLRSWHLGILFVFPFIAVWGAAIAGIYPYIGGRHTVFLAPFVIAAVSYVLTKLFGRKLWAALVVAILVVVASDTSGKTFEPFIKKENQRRPLMTDAMTYVHQSVPQSDLILVDLQSRYPLEYYLCGPAEPTPIETSSPKFGCGGYSVVSTDYHIWQLAPENFASQFQTLAAGYNWKPGDRVWVFQTGWGANLSTELSWYVLKFHCITPKNFGENITVIPFVVGPDLSPALPPGSPRLNRMGRCSD